VVGQSIRLVMMVVLADLLIHQAEVVLLTHQAEIEVLAVQSIFQTEAGRLLRQLAHTLGAKLMLMVAMQAVLELSTLVAVTQQMPLIRKTVGRTKWF